MTAPLRDHKSRPPVSCYIRTLNEERKIGAVLAAAGRVARDIHVVDSGSTDHTLEIAEAAGAHIIHQPWLGSGLQKRVGEEACTHDWLLDLDADEVLSDALIDEIHALFADGAPQERAFKLPLVTTPAFGKPWYNGDVAYRAKLYDRRKVRMPESKIWDQLGIKRERLPRLKGALLHHAIADMAQVVARVNKAAKTRGGAKNRPFGMVLLRLYFGFPVYFFKSFVLRRRFMSGPYGFSLAFTLAFGRWLQDVRMYERHRERTG
ncbi:MAG: glycosyltransferase family 2 protein [Pseudomonadota bacterium]